MSDDSHASAIDDSSQLGERGEQIGVRHVGDVAQRGIEEVAGEQLAAGRLRRAGGEVRIGEQAVEQVRSHSSGRSQRTVEVTRLRAARDPRGGDVQQAVAGAGVERERRSRVDEREVGDPAEVQRGRRRVAAAQPQDVECARERRALTAGCDVAGAQVGDDGHAGAFGDPGRLAELHRPERGAALDPVEDRLPVADDQFGADVGHGGGELLPEQGVERAQLCQRWSSRAAGRRAAARAARPATRVRDRPTGRRTIVAPSHRRSASATSIASIDVPESRPTTSIEPV